MKQIYANALYLLEARIKSCGRALQKETDGYSIVYFIKELNKANRLKARIHARLNSTRNVIKVDFVSKKRAA